MGKRTRLEIYDDYPTDAIDNAIRQWIKDHKQRVILHYKLVEGYTYEQTAELATKSLGYYVSTESVKDQVYKAEMKLFPKLQIIYNH